MWDWFMGNPGLGGHLTLEVTGMFGQHPKIWSFGERFFSKMSVNECREKTEEKSNCENY